VLRIVLRLLVIANVVLRGVLQLLVIANVVLRGVLQLLVIANIVLRTVLQLLVIANVVLRIALQLLVIANVPSSLIPFTRMMEAIRCTETSVFTRATLRHIPEDGIFSMTKPSYKNAISLFANQHKSCSIY
jgi:hypothetical protein